MLFRSLYNPYTREPIDALDGAPVDLNADLEHLRDEAARLFCASAPANLLRLCAAQQMVHLEQNVGPLETDRAYSPEIYEPREDVVARFDSFLASGAQCFAVVGEPAWAKQPSYAGSWSGRVRRADPSSITTHGR